MPVNCTPCSCVNMSIFPRQAVVLAMCTAPEPEAIGSLLCAYRPCTIASEVTSLQCAAQVYSRRRPSRARPQPENAAPARPSVHAARERARDDLVLGAARCTANVVSSCCSGVCGHREASAYAQGPAGLLLTGSRQARHTATCE